MLMIGLEAVPYGVSLPSHTRTCVSVHICMAPSMGRHFCVHTWREALDGKQHVHATTKQVSSFASECRALQGHRHAGVSLNLPQRETCSQV